MLGGNPTCEVLREGYKRLMGLCVWLVSVRAQKLSPSLLGLLTLHSLYILYIYIRERERERERGRRGRRRWIREEGTLTLNSPPRTMVKMKPDLCIGCGALCKRAFAPWTGRVACCVGDRLHVEIARVADNAPLRCRKSGDRSNSGSDTNCKTPRKIDGVCLSSHPYIALSFQI